MILGKILNKMLHNVITDQPKVIFKLNTKKVRLQETWLAKQSNIIMVKCKFSIRSFIFSLN